MTAAEQAAFLDALAESPNVSAACRAAGVPRRTVYNHRATDAEFAAAWDDALEQSTDALVGEAYRRALKGTERPVFYQGDECGRIREYSDTLAIFLLKAHRRDVYGDRVRQDVDMTVEARIAIPDEDSRFLDPGGCPAEAGDPVGADAEGVDPLRAGGDG